MDQDYRRLAAKYIRRQAKQLAGQLDGMREDADIEYVHRARVATRRLRAALEVFADCFPSKRLERWRKTIRRTTDALSDARDRDVQIEYLCDALAGLKARDCAPGVAAVLVRRERDRRRLQGKVVEAADRLQRKGTLREMRRESKKILRQSNAGGQNQPSPDTLDRAGRHIRRQMDRLLERQKSLADPFDRKGHHAMRIAVKRFRYTMEICRPLYPGKLKDPLKAIKRVQTLLGEIHDCDVWLEDLEGFAAAERKRIVAALGRDRRFRRLLPGVEYLQEDRRRRRREAFGELVEYWRELNDRRFWDRLTAVIGESGV